MKEYLFYVLILFFLLIYLLRAFLIVGYEHIKYRGKADYSGIIAKDLLRKLISFKPLTQSKLEPKGYDYKVYVRYQKKFHRYYIVIWITLFSILMLFAILYLGATF